MAGKVHAHRRSDRSSGFAYVAVLIILFMLTALGMAFILRAGLIASAVSHSKESNQAQYLAESAVNHAMWRLTNEDTFPLDETKYYMHSMGAGRYGYKVRRHTENQFATIAGVGAVGDTVFNQSHVLYIPTGTPEVLCDNGLIAYYNFDEPSGSTINDSSTSAEHALIVGGEGDELSDGLMSGAINFDGSDDKVQTVDGSSLILTGDYSFSVWVKPDATQNQWAGIFSKTNAAGSVNHWTLQFNDHSSREIEIRHGSGIWDTGLELADVADTWSNIIIVRSGTTMTSYLNGAMVATGTLTTNPLSGAGHLNIGAERTFSNSYVYEGQIDELRIYDRPLNSSEVFNLATLGCDCLEGHWKMDDGSGTAVLDSSGEGRDGVIASMTEDWVDGQIAGALDFDGGNGHVTGLGDVPTESFTLAGWVKDTGGSGWKVIYSADQELWFGVDTGGNAKLYADVGGNGHGANTANGTWTQNVWHHVAVTWNGDDVHIYIDGADMSTTVYGTPNNPQAEPGIFGAWSDNPNNENWVGPMDDMRLYTRALNSDEVAVLATLSGDLIVSMDSSATLGGVSLESGDTAVFSNTSTTEHLDGDTEFSETENVDAFHMLESGNYLISTEDSSTIGGLTLNEHDLAEFDPGAGTATLYFDGATHFGASENINGIAILPNGNLAISTLNPATLGALSFEPEDVVEYDPGTTTATMLFDGSTYLSGSSTINGVHVESDGNLLITIEDASDNIGPLAFNNYDVVRFDMGTLTASLYFDGEREFGNTTENIDSISSEATASASGDVFWYNHGDKVIYGGNKDGTGQQSIVAGLGDVKALAWDRTGQKIYWADKTDDDIKRANEDGTSVETLVTSQGDVKAFRLDLVNGKIYWAEKEDEVVRRSNLDGTSVEDIATNQGDVKDLVLDTANGHVYWSEKDDQVIRKSDLDGSNLEDIATGQADAKYLAMDSTNGYVYWADNTDDVIRRIAVGGASPSILGYDTIYGSTQGSVSKDQLSTQVTASSNMTIKSIIAYVGGKKDKDIRYALYTDTSGEPGTLIVESATARQSTDSYAWFSIDIADTAIVSGTTYWLALAFNHNNQNYTYDGGVGEVRYNNTDAAASGFDASWGSSTASLSRRISIYASESSGSGSVEDVVTSVADPKDLEVDPAGGKLYWADKGDKKIKRANLDGSSEEDLVTSVDDLKFIALDVGDGKFYWGDKGDDDIKRAEFDGSNVETLFTGMTDPKFFAN